MSASFGAAWSAPHPMTRTVPQSRVFFDGLAVPLNGQGTAAGYTYGGTAAPAANTGVFVAQAGPLDGSLGFGFEKVEDGSAEGFNFAMYVTEVERGSWAERKGIDVGCRILRFNGEDVSSQSTEQLKEQLQYWRPFDLQLYRSTGLGEQAAPAFRIQKVREDDFNTPDDYFQESVNVAAKRLNNLNINDYTPDVSKALFEVPPGVLKMFPTVFLLFSLAVFVMPVYLVWHVGEDPNTKQWFPQISRLVLILPAVYFLTFWAHVFKRAPSRFFITLSLMGSCVMLLIVSDVLLIHAYEQGPMFGSVGDCMSWGEKRTVEQQWQAARSYYTTCMQEMAQKQSLPLAAAVHDLRIQDCPTYANVSAVHPDWAYLEYLETTQSCGGWCTASPPIWIKGNTQDACSPIVAQIIRDKIAWTLKQVCIYTVFTLLVVSVMLIGMPSFLRRYGIEW